MKETRTLEYKQEITNSFLKTVSAYANFGTGVIEFGIGDDGTVIGMKEPDRACLDIENKINDSVSPKPDYTLRINRKNNVITLTVAEGSYKPYLYKGKAYRRSDTATIEVDNLELKRLTLEGSNLYFEELSVDETELSFHYLEEKLKEKIGIAELTDDMLRTFGFYTKDMKYNNAAALFADRNSFYGIDAVRFGKSISEIMDRETYSGMSVLKQYDDAVKFYSRYYQFEKIDGFERRGAEMIPEEAFRETIANALVHRTWDIRSHIKVEMYADRIEVLSPGGLPRGLSEEEYLNGTISSLRNPIMGNMFFRMHYIEMFGTGIRRIKESYAECAVQPSFEIFDNSIKVILPVVNGTKSVTADGLKILSILGGSMQYSSSELAAKLGWGKDKTIKELKALKKAGYINIIGSGRGTKYEKS